MESPCCPQTQNLIEYVSPVIALLAVFVGPLLTLKMTERQIREAREAEARQSARSNRLANKQIVAPMRQAWIEKLRSDIASLVTLCNRYAMRGTPDHNDLYDEMFQCELVIELSLNPAEKDHIAILQMLHDLILTVAQDTTNFSDNEWNDFRYRKAEIVEMANTIFRREWTRVKSEDAN